LAQAPLPQGCRAPRRLCAAARRSAREARQRWDSPGARGGMAAEGERATSWQKCRLPHNLGALEAFDALEVLLLARSLQSASPVQRQGMSDGARRARDALAESPHSMLWINELGRIYADEAQWDKCEIALLRGWKRAGEIEDPGVRLCFLLKLCEVSYYLRKHKQAMAVLKDIDEPEAPDEFQAYLLLACRVHACNNDLEGAMRFFSRAIERETFQSSLKVLALTMFDLQKAGAYEPAKHAVESMAGSCDKDQLRIFDDALEQRERPGAKIDRLFMYALMGAKVFAILCVVFLLYQWEQSSLERWAKAKASQEL